jgi:CheY-like chemotaxis protein
MARERGFDTLVAGAGEEGFQLARRNRPDAITLDLELPDVDGWEIADRLKADPQTRDIAVHVISVRDRPQRSARHGVASYTTKPADLETLAQVFAEVTAQMALPLRVLLLIENDLEKRDAITAALAGPDRAFDAVSSAAEALAALRKRPYQGVVVELDLPDEDGMALLQQIRSDPALAAIPAVLYSERALDDEAMERVRRLDAAVVGDGGHPLAEETDELAGFLQRVKRGIPVQAAAPAAPAAAAGAEAGHAALRGKCVLIVDDDARNLFALTGLLENAGMEVNAVETGEEALRQLDTRPGIDVVLMDIMMPDMDGYETMRRIRADARFAKLPIIALTAKAMLEDRTKCLAAGASDYASKPVDTEQLLAQLDVWLAEHAKAPD